MPVLYINERIPEDAIREEMWHLSAMEGGQPMKRSYEGDN